MAVPTAWPSPAQPVNLSSTLESAFQVLTGLQAYPRQEMKDTWCVPGIPKAEHSCDGAAALLVAHLDNIFTFSSSRLHFLHMTVSDIRQDKGTESRAILHRQSLLLQA